MRHAKSRLTIHQLVDGQNGKDGLTPQPNLLRDAHLPLTLGAWNKNTNNGGSINFESNVVPPITGVNVWTAFSAPQSESFGELYQHLSFISGKTYTFSVYAKGANSGWLITWPIGVHQPLVETKQVEENGLPDGWKRYAVTFTADKSGGANAYLRSWFQVAQRMSGKVYFAAPKLEEGRVATPWLRAQADFKGDDGVGVSAVLSEYAVSSSENSAPSSGWSTTLPTWQQGQYLWTRSRVTFTDGRVVTTTPQVDSAWKKLSELAYEQAHMAYLKQVFAQRAGIEGGLLFGSMLQMRDIPFNGATNGEVTAYLNGLRSTKVGNAPRPALALGVKNFGKADEKEAIALNFDGSGHIGDLQFDGTGSLFTRGDDGTVLTELTRQPRCDINAIVQRAEHKIIISPNRLDNESNKYSREFEVTSPYGLGKIEYTLSVSGIPKHSDASAHKDINSTIAYVGATVFLEYKVGAKPYTKYLWISNVSTDAGSNSYEGSFDLVNLPVGKYRIYLSFYSANMNYERAIFRTRTAEYTEGLITPFNAIASDGIMSFHSAQQYTYIKEGKLHIKGKHDMPGLLASGKVDADGTPSSLWGLATKVYRRSTGEYLILHSIGHTDYSIIITPIGNGNLLVGQLAMQTIDTAWCFIRDVQRNCNLTNTPFTFAIIGRN